MRITYKFKSGSTEDVLECDGNEISVCPLSSPHLTAAIDLGAKKESTTIPRGTSSLFPSPGHRLGKLKGGSLRSIIWSLRTTRSSSLPLMMKVPFVDLQLLHSRSKNTQHIDITMHFVFKIGPIRRQKLVVFVCIFTCRFLKFRKWFHIRQIQHFVLNFPLTQDFLSVFIASLIFFDQLIFSPNWQN